MGKLRFPSLPVTSHAGTTLNFEKLQKTLPILEALQSKSTTPAYLSWGLISEAGSILYGSGDYTMANPSAGRYELTWKVAKTSANYVVLFGGLAKFNIITVEGAQKTTGFKIEIVTHLTVEESTQFAFAVLASS